MISRRHETTISIIICTCNRAEFLRLTLASLQTVCVPADVSCELIVVDNGSTDATAEVVQSCVLSHMSLRYLHEPRQGQCHARNTGIAAARGQVILFTDDDLRFPTHWVESMCRPILVGQWDAIAGGVKMARSLVRPWMWPGLRGAMADTDHLDPNAPQNLIGANMAFSRSVLEKVPEFDTELGPGALGFADDVLFSQQLKAAGCQIGGALDNAVEHHFDPSRLTHGSLLKAARNHGRSLAFVAYHWDHVSFALPHLRLARCALRLAARRFRQSSAPAHAEGITQWEFEGVQIVEFFKGYLRECRRPRQYDRHGLIKRQQK